MRPAAFDEFLHQLSGLLGLSASQRQAIRHELADHFESQFDDLTAGGATAEEAVDRILCEFGDAADLAARFRQIGQGRRWIMRSFAAASVVVLATLATSFLMPHQPGNPVSPAMTAGDGPPSDAVRSAVRVLAIDSEKPADTSVDRALAVVIPKAHLDSLPLKDAVDFVRQAAGVNIVVDWMALDRYGIAMDAPISLQLESISASRLLDLVLWAAGAGAEGAPGWRVEDGVVMISGQDVLRARTVVQLYDCPDLIRSDMPEWAIAVVRRATDDPAALSSALEMLYELRTRELRQVIQGTVAPETWKDAGGDTGSITAYDNVLVVVQTPENHEAIHVLLTRLVEMRKQ